MVIVRTSGNQLELYEVKASETFNKDFLKNINYLKNLFGDKIATDTIVYDGEPVHPFAINIRKL